MRMPADATGHHPPDGRIQPPALTAGAAYASEINRLKALVAKLQRMQFGKSSEKLRAKTERQIQEAQERISALQEEMEETLGEQYDRHCHHLCASLLPVNRYRPHFPVNVNATMFDRYGDADDFLDSFIIPARIVGGTFWG